MRSTMLGFEVQKRTLQMANKCQDIVGNNVANINTPGYTRQRVDLYAMYVSGNRELRWSSPTNSLSLNGYGVNAYGVSQVRDKYIDKRYRENVSIEAETEKMMTILSEVEDVLDNFETDGLQYHTQQFFNALQDYSEAKPDSREVATIARNAATNLCQALNGYYKDIKQIEDTYVRELEDTVQYVNGMLEQMNFLNEKIAKEKFHYPNDYGPNELYDELNMYVDELSTYGNIFVTYNSNGTFSVDMAGVRVLDGEKFKTNSIMMRDYDDYGEAILHFSSGEDLILQSGILKGYQNMINGNGVYATGNQNGYYGIAYFKSALNAFASTLAQTFNKANGYEEPGYENRAMFMAQIDGIETDSVVITAGNIHVSEAWMDDPTMIGQTRTLENGTWNYEYGYKEITDTEGNVTYQNTNVLYLISQFDNINLSFGNANDFKGSVYEYISFISNRLGQTIQYEKSRYDTAVVTVNELLDARDDVSGVTLDEEGLNMLNYQKWFAASSRITTAIDDMLDKLINGTGRVGL